MTPEVVAPHLQIGPGGGDLFPAGSYYQQDEETLYIPALPFDPQHRFFSYLESDHVRFDISLSGHLLFAEVNIPCHKWRTQDIAAPFPATQVEARWLDFRRRMRNPTLITNSSKTVLKIMFLPQSPCQIYRLTESISLSLTEDNRLASFWITHIENDFAGRNLARFRKQYRRNHPIGGAVG